MNGERLRIAMLRVHSSPIGELGKRDTGGMSVYIRELARELGSRGHWVDIYTRLTDPKHTQRIELHENVRLIPLRAGKNGRMEVWRSRPSTAISMISSGSSRDLEHAKTSIMISYTATIGCPAGWGTGRKSAGKFLMSLCFILLVQ